MWRTKKFWGILILILLVLGGAFYYFKTKDNTQATSYTTGKVEPGGILPRLLRPRGLSTRQIM